MINITSKSGTVACSIAAYDTTECIADAVLAAYACCRVVSEHTGMSKAAASIFIVQQIQDYLSKGDE